LIDCDQLSQRLADILFRASGVIDVEFFGVRVETLPVFGPEKWL